MSNYQEELQNENRMQTNAQMLKEIGDSSSSSSSTNEFQDIVMSDYEKTRNENLERNAQRLKEILSTLPEPDPEPKRTLKTKKVKEVIVKDVDSKRQTGRTPAYNPDRICRACDVYIGNCGTDPQKAMAGN